MAIFCMKNRTIGKVASFEILAMNCYTVINNTLTGCVLIVAVENVVSFVYQQQQKTNDSNEKI